MYVLHVHKQACCTVVVGEVVSVKSVKVTTLEYALTREHMQRFIFECWWIECFLPSDYIASLWRLTVQSL